MQTSASDRGCSSKMLYIYLLVDRNSFMPVLLQVAQRAGSAMQGVVFPAHMKDRLDCLHDHLQCMKGIDQH